MRRVKIICSLFWLLFALTTVMGASRLKMGELHQPGPGFFPFSMGLLMAVFSLFAVFQSLKAKETGPTGEQKTRVRWWNVVLIPLAMAGYAVSLERVGFLINTFLLITLLLKVVEPQPWKTAVLAGVITALAAHVVFNILLGAQIPSGLLGF